MNIKDDRTSLDWSVRSITQFIVLVSGSSLTTFVLIPRTLMENKEQNKDLQMIFIDLENTEQKREVHKCTRNDLIVF